MRDFGLLNWSVIGIYILSILVMGVFLSRHVKTANHYFLGDRTMPWWAIGVSVIATYFGALTFLGGPAWAYQEGFSVVLIHVNYPIAVFIVVTLFLPFFYNSGVASIYEYLEQRFGPTSRTVMSGVFLFGNFAYSGIMLYTSALILQFITDVAVVDAIIIVAAIAVIYTMLGGISAVIWTDVTQTVIQFVGVLIVLVILLNELPQNTMSILADLKAAKKTDPFNFSTDPSRIATVWTGIIAMSIYHVTVYGVNQMMVQRALTAKTLGDAKKAYHLMGYCAFLFFALFFFIGILFYSYYGGREFENDNLIVLEFVSLVGVPGLLGIITAAIVAASMSSLDSSLNSMATVTTLDFYQKYFKKDESESHYLKASRFFTFGWAVLIVLPAIAFTRSDGSVLELLSKIGSYFVGAKLSSYCLGFFSKHATEKGMLTGVAAGFLVLLYVELQMDVAWPWYCLVGGVVSLVVGWGSSVIFDGFQARYHPLTIKGQQERFRREQKSEMEDGWYILPGRVDKSSYVLLVYFVFCMLGLWTFENII